jgi:hypothetical protein
MQPLMQGLPGQVLPGRGKVPDPTALAWHWAWGGGGLDGEPGPRGPIESVGKVRSKRTMTTLWHAILKFCR